MRWNTDFTGWARMAMTLSWISRVSSSRSSSPTEMPDDRARPLSTTRWASMACWITSSPTTLISRSTRSRSTRMVGAALAAVTDGLADRLAEGVAAAAAGRGAAVVAAGAAPAADGATAIDTIGSSVMGAATSAWARASRAAMSNAGAASAEAATSARAVKVVSQSLPTKSNTSRTSLSDAPTMSTVQAR